MNEEQQIGITPLNRGGQAILGTILLVLLFALAGPLIGAVAALGLAGFLAGPFVYGLGLVPALITGVAFSTFWLLGFGARQRVAWTAAVGVVASGVLSFFHESGGLLPFMAAWAGGIAGLACAWLANRLIAATERSRIR